MASPPKPWERPGAAATVASAARPTTLPTTTAASISTPPAQGSSAIATASADAPAVPQRPASLAASVNQNAAAYSSGMANPYGTYGGGAGYNSYSRMGGYGGYGGTMGGMYGSSMYGGYGGYGGSMYGGGMYGGMPGMGQNPNDPNSLTNQFNNSTQATFQMLQGIVQAFGGFAQMLESTYMATHSSFFGMLLLLFQGRGRSIANPTAAMVSVAEQFGNLKDTLGSILGIFTLMRWIRTLLAKLTGRPPPADATSLTPAAFARFEGRQPIGPDGTPLGPPKASRKPSSSSSSLPSACPGEQAVQQQLDPSKLDYCRALYDFTPQPGNAVQGVDMEVRRGELVAVLSKSDPIGNPSEWWRCRARDGRTGYLPATYLEVIKRPGQPVAAIKAAASESSRTSTMTSTVESVPEPVKSKVGDVSAESFQKSQFYS
ncbi:peroxisomal membrane protein PAS20 [Verticillium alfalfae VaMs.102]|uniref:Peroxisomal membrane protein PEX13 n=1 Tax=Verticillium alfalfae (strain VaMs.102 / ATCC MYA-4576 / FGSC 10136) TaxID=526221 RepID=C9SH52_VERA1|nr:peroxisomal membrane protein PAS20 [Verticillium alfalfae VaMs.102]EEY17646.1 peroxisomal membrane protein PAS20 [Verticillium alfalfae VaMs.102]